MAKLQQTIPQKEDLRFVGCGPKATGSSGGWHFEKSVFVRCRKCGDFLHPWAAKESGGCSCGALFIDADYHRFSARDGDESVEVFRSP